MVADKNATVLTDIVAGTTLVADDGTEYTMTPQAIKFGDDLSVAMAKDIVFQVEEQKRQLLLVVVGLREQLEQQKKEQADIYYYLNKKLDDNFETISSLEEQLLTEQGDREVAERISERKIEELSSKLVIDDAKSGSRIQSLEAALDNVRDYIEKKESNDRKVTDLTSSIEREREEFRTQFDALEMKAIKEKSALESTFAIKLQELQSQYEANLNAGLEDLTREIFLENTGLHKELATQSKEVNNILAINTSVINTDRLMRNELQLSQASEKELLKRLGTYQHLIKRLTQKITELEIKCSGIAGSSDGDIGSQGMEPLGENVIINNIYITGSNIQLFVIPLCTGRYFDNPEKVS